MHDTSRLSKKNEVNLHYWEISDKSGVHNLGDWLSPIIVDYMLQREGLSLDYPIKGKKHLYAIGSIIDFGCQNATIWGSGFLEKPRVKFQYKLRKLDVRCVRGPKSKEILCSLGYSCPEIYGDPGLLLPIFYNPKIYGEKKDVSVVLNFFDTANLDTNKYNVINILTDDWESTVDKIVNSRLVISSSLHGIIVAEAYGIPAVLLMPNINRPGGLFKYYDYYMSTDRRVFPVAKTVEEAIALKPLELKEKNLRLIQENLINCFPYDLWINELND